MTIQGKRVFSSFVDGVYYDDEVEELTIYYQGGKGGGIYAGVPPDVADKVLTAASVGEALHAHVRGKFPHRLVNR